MRHKIKTGNAVSNIQQEEINDIGTTSKLKIKGIKHEEENVNTYGCAYISNHGRERERTAFDRWDKEYPGSDSICR